jgi:glycosyltransferase involved in cell wall biosynthesis
MPKLSVCIPTYNTAAYLPEAIESVLSQGFTDYELLICDDGSTDETPELVRRYGDPRIQYFRSEHRLGQAHTWNRCVALAKGRYVALLHADDRYLDGFLESRISTLDREADVGMAFGAVRLIDEHGAAVAERCFSSRDIVFPAPEFLRHLLLDCVIFPPSVVVRRTCYETVGPFNEARFWGIDWELWLRLSTRYGVAYSAAITSAYRVHAQSATPVALSTARNASDGFDVLMRIFSEIDSSPQLASYASLRRAALCAFAMRALSAAGYMCERGNLAAVRTNLRYALRANPKLLSRPTVWALALSCWLGRGMYRAFRVLRPI